MTSAPVIEELKPGVKAPARETLLTPRFYVTDFDAVAQMNISTQVDELEAMLGEMRADYNRHHFVRTPEFEQSWAHLDESTRQTFIDFLERSCTSEFSGFLLFKELSRRLKDGNPLLAEMFQLMARDEARHAGFLNKAMSDFGISLDLGYLTKNRTYTFFKPEWIMYAVYLSEKIGYWRYITVFRHLEKHPEYQYYPLFKFFESWCQDENRHGDIFSALIRSQEPMWNTITGRLWSKFFLLSVFFTHSLTVHERADFYHSIGLDPTEYDRIVITNTNKVSERAFPVILNTDDPNFFPYLEQSCSANAKIAEIEQSSDPKWLKALKKLPHQATIVINFVQMYFIPSIDTQSHWGEVR